MSDKTFYVAGFMFDGDGDNVALIKKNRPAWQKDKTNAIGGHVEQFETGIDAMVREFEEETGLQTKPEDWKRFVILHGNDFEVQFFCAVGDLGAVQSRTDEDVLVLPVKYLKLYNTIPNLQWLIPAAQLALKQPSPLLSIVECEQ